MLHESKPSDSVYALFWMVMVGSIVLTVAAGSVFVSRVIMERSEAIIRALQGPLR